MECLEQLTPRMGLEYLVRYGYNILYGNHTCTKILKRKKIQRARYFIQTKLLNLETNMYHGIEYCGIGHNQRCLGSLDICTCVIILMSFSMRTLA